MPGALGAAGRILIGLADVDQDGTGFDATLGLERVDLSTGLGGQGTQTLAQAHATASTGSTGAVISGSPEAAACSA